MSELIQLTFDYEANEIGKADARSLEKNARVVTETTERIRKTTAEGVLKIGKELAAAHERLANNKNGTFGKWVRERCGMAPRTAQVMMAASEAFGYSATVAQYFDASAMYLLSAECCPEEAAQEAMGRADKGEHISKKVAKEIIDSYTVDTDESDDEVIEEAPDEIPDDWSLLDVIREVRDVASKWRTATSDASVVAQVLRDVANQLEGKVTDEYVDS